ncbi:MAG: hypothetical protein NVSMB9_23990 [Isosphaeraceae bacterium]
MSDGELIRAYASFGKTVDRIAAYLPLRNEFLSHLPERPNGPDDDTTIWRLFQLRKTGMLTRGNNTGADHA